MGGSLVASLLSLNTPEVKPASAIRFFFLLWHACLAKIHPSFRSHLSSRTQQGNIFSQPLQLLRGAATGARLIDDVTRSAPRSMCQLERLKRAPHVNPTSSPSPRPARVCAAPVAREPLRGSSSLRRLVTPCQTATSPLRSNTALVCPARGLLGHLAASQPRWSPAKHCVAQRWLGCHHTAVRDALQEWCEEQHCRG